MIPHPLFRLENPLEAGPPKKVTHLMVRSIMADRLTRTLKKKYPKMSRNEIAAIRKSIIEIVGSHLDVGEELAFVKDIKEGNTKLSVIRLQDPFEEEREIKSTNTITENLEERILGFQISLPALISLENFADESKQIITAVDFLYSVFAIVASQSINTISILSEGLRQQILKAENEEFNIQRYLSHARVEPLQLISIHYGSPLTVDVLGIGQGIETVREIIKDISWRAKHEKQMAQFEQESKKIEMRKASLENQKAVREIALQSIQVEKSDIELASQKLDLIERVANLNLPTKDKQILLWALGPRIAILAKNKVTLSSKIE